MSMKNPVVLLVSRSENGSINHYVQLTSLFEQTGFVADNYELPQDLTVNPVQITAYVDSTGANIKLPSIVHHQIPVTAIDLSSSRTLNISIKNGSDTLASTTVIVSTEDPEADIRPIVFA